MVNDLIKDFNLELKVSEKIGRSAFLVVDNKNTPFVLKYQPPSTGLIHVFWRFLLGGSLPFQNEFRVLEEVDNYSEKYFCIPKTINKKEKHFFLTEFINQKETLDIEEIRVDIKKKIAFSLFEIKNISRPKKFFFLKEILFRILESPTRKIVLDAIKVKKTNKISFLSFLRIYLKCVLKRIFVYKKIPSSLIHNDMGPNNILLNLNEDVFIIDWEDTLWEKRWPLLDITDFSYRISTGSLDLEIMRFFYLNAKKKYPNISAENFKNHFTFGYLRAMLRLLNMKRINDEEKEKIISSLNILLKSSKDFKNMLNTVIK